MNTPRNDYQQYIPPLQELVRTQLKEDWMDEEDWVLYEGEILQQVGLSYNQMAREVAQGVEAGYPVSLQLSLVRDALKFVK